MKKKFLYISALSLALLCACTKKENNEKPIMTPTPTATVAPTETQLPTPTNTPAATPTPTADVIAQWYINGLETVSVKELDCCVDREDSIRNSNLLNYGWLTYDTEGNIYYSEENKSGIYTCTASGENKRLLCDAKGDSMQVNGEWLYYRNQKDKKIYRIHITSGEIEKIYELSCVEFIINDDKIMVDAAEEFCIVDLNGENKEIIKTPTEINLFTFTSCNEFWLSNAGPVVNKGYLFKFDGEKISVLKERGTFPLLAGHYLSVIDTDTLQRHIWNLETNQKTNFEKRTEKAVVSDGSSFYYASWNMKNNKYTSSIYRWDGKKSEEILVIEDAKSIYHLFLTPEKLYYLPHMDMDRKTVPQLWYYDLEIGETGQIY